MVTFTCIFAESYVTAEDGAFSTVEVILTSLTRATSRSSKAGVNEASHLLGEFASLQPTGARSGTASMPSMDLLRRLATFIAKDSTGKLLKKQLLKDEALRNIQPTLSKSRRCEALKENLKISEKVSIYLLENIL